MALTSPSSLLSSLLLLCAITLATARPPPSIVALDPDPFETLKKNGLPIGLIPNTVVKAEMNSQGWFRVELSSNCRTSVHNTGEVPIYYSTVLSGKIEYGRLLSLKGISAKPPELPIWVNVRSIYVDAPSSDVVHISVGWGISEQLPRAAFDVFPVCQNELVKDEDAVSSLLVAV